jgi:hypothetical protein
MRWARTRCRELQPARLSWSSSSFAFAAGWGVLELVTPDGQARAAEKAAAEAADAQRDSALRRADRGAAPAGILKGQRLTQVRGTASVTAMHRSHPRRRPGR